MRTTWKTDRVRMRLMTVIAAVLALTLTGCTGGDDDDTGGGGDPAALQARLEAAKATIDDAASLEFSIGTDRLPNGVAGLLTAKGVGQIGNGDTPPAFEGEVVVVTGGTSIDAEVVAIDTTVWAKTGFSPVFLTIDPKTLKAPNPASLIGSGGDGISSILTSTEGLTEGDRTRDGKDVLTTIEGEIPGAVVAKYLPSADQDRSFRVSYRLTDDDVLRDATITGQFYPDAVDVTYTVRLTASDTAVTIEKPKR